MLLLFFDSIELNHLLQISFIHDPRPILHTYLYLNQKIICKVSFCNRNLIWYEEVVRNDAAFLSDTDDDGTRLR